MSEEKKVRFTDLAEICRELNTLTNRQFRPGHQLVKLFHALSRFSQVSEYYKDEEQVLHLFNIYNLDSKHTHPYVITQLAKIIRLDKNEQKDALARFANRLDEHEQWEWESRRKAKHRRKSQLSPQLYPYRRVQSVPDLSSNPMAASPKPNPQAPMSRAQSFTTLKLAKIDAESRQTSYSSLSSEDHFNHFEKSSHDYEDKRSVRRLSEPLNHKVFPAFESDMPEDGYWPRWSDWMGGIKKWWDGDDRERYEAEMYYREQQQKYGDFPPPRRSDFPPMHHAKYGGSSFEGTREHISRTRSFPNMALNRFGDYDYLAHEYSRREKYPRDNCYNKGGSPESRWAGEGERQGSQRTPHTTDEIDWRYSRI